MESEHGAPTPEQAAAALQEAERSRTVLAQAIVPPSWLFTTLGGAVAVQIATAAIGLGVGMLWLLVAGVVLLVLVAGVQLARFPRRNGVWLGGFAGRVVLGTGNAASTSYAVSLAVAIWAGYGGRWWLVAICAVVGGGAYAYCGARWLRAYRERPEELGRGESALWLVGLSLAAIAGLVALLLNG